MAKIIIENDKLRVVEELPARPGGRAYWLEVRSHYTGEWQRTRGPFRQRPAAIRWFVLTRDNPPA